MKVVGAEFHLSLSFGLGLIDNQYWSCVNTLLLIGRQKLILAIFPNTLFQWEMLTFEHTAYSLISLYAIKFMRHT